MNIQLPPIILPDVVQPRVPETLRQELQPNQKVTAVVEAELGDNLYLLRFGNQQTRARSDQPLRAGSTVELQVQQSANTQVLKLLGTPMESPGTVTLRTALCQLMPRMVSQSEWQKTLQHWAGSAITETDSATVTTRLAAPAANAMQATTSSASTAANLSSAAGPLARAILDSFPDFASLGDAGTLRESVTNSGLFWDRNQLEGQTSSGMPDDLKGRLIQLVRLLQTSIDGMTRPVPMHPALRPGEPLPLRTPAEWANLIAGQPRDTTVTPPLPSAGGRNGAVGNALQEDSPQRQNNQPTGEAELLQHLETLDDATVESLQQQIDLLRKTEGTLAQLVMHQIHSQTSTNDNSQVWRMDIPYRDPQGQPQTMQLEIQRERQNTPEQAALPPTWRIDIRLDPPGLGPLHGQLGLSGDRVDAVLWSQLAATSALVNNHLETLKARLVQAGLDVRSLKAMQGSPSPVDHNHVAGPAGLGRSLIDERA